MVLLHGIGAHAGFWRAVMPGLVGKYRVLVPDMCGSGRSEVPAEVSRELFGSWLADFIRQVGASPANVVGNSMGGAVALATSLDFAGAVRSLVLANSLGLGKSIGLGFRIVSVPILGEFLVPTRAKAIRREIVRLTYSREWVWDGLAEETEELAQNSEARRYFFRTLRWGTSLFGGVRRQATAADELHKLTIPVRIIWGRQDPVFPLKLARSAVQAIPQADLVVIEECGHMPHMERPDEFNAHVVEFLSTQDERTG